MSEFSDSEMVAIENAAEEHFQGMLKLPGADSVTAMTAYHKFIAGAKFARSLRVSNLFRTFPHVAFVKFCERVERQDHRPPTLTEAAYWSFTEASFPHNEIQYSIDKGAEAGDATILTAIHPSGMVEHYELVKVGADKKLNFNTRDAFEFMKKRNGAT